MKKLCWLFAAIMTVITLWVFSACASDSMDRVSERRSGYYTASCDGYTLTAVSGVRESTFKADGKAEALIPYTLITIVPDDFDIDAVITYAVEADGCTFGGTMIVHPFAASFSAEFEHETTSKEFSVTIKQSGESHNFTAQSQITSDMMKFDRAISAAKASVAPSGEYEIRARIIKNPLGDGLCWHINFITAEGDSGVLLDPVTAKVLAKK